ALFDLRSRHLVAAFQAAITEHNNQHLNQHVSSSVRDVENDDVTITFDPVITFVDVTDSFAVSNAMCDLIAHDVIAIVGVTNASSLPTIQSYSATFHVPFLSLGSSQNMSSAAPFQISLRPPAMAAVADLLQHHGCTSALYVYDTDEGLMRIQDLFHAVNIRDIWLELDVRRVGDKSHVIEVSRIIGSLQPKREICLLLDVERLATTGVVTSFALDAQTVKDIVLVTMDGFLVLHDVTTSAGQPRPFNVSALQLVSTDINQPFSQHSVHANPFQETMLHHEPLQDLRVSFKLDPHDLKSSSEALVSDSLRVLDAAVVDVMDSADDLFEESDEESAEDMTMKCTNFVVEKKKHGAELMDALRLVHIYGDTGYIRFDSSGKREDYTIGALSVPAGESTITKIGEWSSASGLTSRAAARDNLRTYTVFGNISRFHGNGILRSAFK
ncbi:hypothetical protein BaRGS_00013493, partial [Batillaria attramentaria]